MNDLLELVQQIKSKYLVVMQQVAATYTQQKEAISQLEKALDEENKNLLKTTGQAAASEVKQQLLKEKAEQQEELSSIERLQQDLSHFFEEDWAQLKDMLNTVRQNRESEQKKHEARLKKLEDKLKELQDEKRELTGLIMQNRQQNEFEYVLEVLPYMPLHVNGTKLIQQPKHVRDEILAFLMEGQPLPERLAKLV